LLDYDVPSLYSVKGKFYYFATAIEKVILGETNKDKPWKDWQYFTDAERQALIEGFKEMKRAKFDNQIMERVFDEKYVERQVEELRKRNSGCCTKPHH
jgi:hypothetical protein